MNAETLKASLKEWGENILITGASIIGCLIVLLIINWLYHEPDISRAQNPGTGSYHGGVVESYEHGQVICLYSAIFIGTLTAQSTYFVLRFKK